MINSSLLFSFFLFFLHFKTDFFPTHNSLKSADNPVISYPKGEFVFPIKPGVTTSLSGSYGDIRFNHFHAGLDIRTGGIEGVPVQAAGDGYVSRIGVSRGGYGNALYITHPNGYTTVYGHLKEYADKIKAKLTAKQYEQKNWEIDTYLKPGEIIVKQGEIVAFSGNTGGSGGPHLHFEIRNQAEETINPALFGFKEITDNLPPEIVKVVLKPMDIDSRINGQFGEVTLTPIKLKNGNYVLNNRITATGKIGLMIYTYDRSGTSPFRLGVTSIRMMDNGSEAYNFDLEKMIFDTKIDMNLHTDYEKMVENGQKYHKLYVEPGNRMKLYSTNKNKGLINITDQKHDLQVTVGDTYQNLATLSFSVLKAEQPQVPLEQSPSAYAPKILINNFDNFIRIQAVSSAPVSTPAIIQYKGTPRSVSPAYQTANSVVYLYDLKEGLCDFVQIGASSAKVDQNVRVSPTKNVLSKENFTIDFQQSLYTDLFLQFENSGNVLNLDKDVYPLKGQYEVNWKNASAKCEKCGVYLAASRPKFLVSNKTASGVVFESKELGKYQILQDNEPPAIRVKKINSAELSFYISDNLSGIKNITCFVNNAWVMMEYEPKLNLIWSEKLDPKVPFTGLLQLTVEDNQGNLQTFERTI